jgi:uncharacterized membrane-anchored protein
MSDQGTGVVATRHVQSKVPHVTVYFWVIIALGGAIGDAGAYFLIQRLHLSPALATGAIGFVLLWAMLLQFSTHRYTPWRYWIAAFAVNVTATVLIQDLVGWAGLPVVKTALAFGIALALTLGIWFLTEGTCSIEMIVTRRREAFYWLAMLFAFCAGTALGSALAWRVGLGFGHAAGVVAIGMVAIGLSRVGHLVSASLAFWSACVLTQPIGASLRDWLALAPQEGGLGLSNLHPSALILFGGAVLALAIARAGLDRPRVTDDEFVKTAPR